MESDIVIRGAREHNLRGVNLRLPRNKLIVMTGVSGSGKSSLAFDTLYAEGQRRYVESLSSYARQFLGQMPKPDVDSITGLAPSISIQQKTSGRNPRSTVGTITEIYDYLRVLFARVGQGFCPQCDRPITAQTREQILESLAKLPEGTRFQVLAPVVQRQKGEYRDLFEDLLKQGFLRARVDGRTVQLTENLQLDRQMRHSIEVVVDRLVAGPSIRTRLAEAIETALRLANGNLIVSVDDDREEASPDERKSEIRNPKSSDVLYSARYACTHCGISYEPPSPQLFSFNSPQGMCPDCNGLGLRHDFDLELLVPDESVSLAKGAVALLEPFREMGRWRRHIFEGVAAALERDFQLKEDSVLKTPWGNLAVEVRQKLLYGTGERHITFSWRHRGGVWKHGGTYAGIIPELLDAFRKAKNPMRRRQIEKFLHVVACATCKGSRLNAQARSVRITSNASRPSTSLGLSEVCALTIANAAQFFEQLDLDATGQLIAEEVLKEIRGRLGFLLRCGLDYLTLDRAAPTLSGGESQRIRLAGQIGCGLVGVVYILDEPSVGLHPRDNEMLLGSLLELRDLGNTVIVVEHDEETIRSADHVIDFGPGPGVRGGELVAEGTLDEIKRELRSITGRYLSGDLRIEVPPQRRPRGKKELTILGARHNNLRTIDVTIPLESFVCVTGVSGSGKSSLVNDILWEALNRDLNKGEGAPGAFKKLKGLDLLDKAINIDQSPIGRTPRSNPATYVKLFDLIRDLYTQLPESKLRGHKPGRFSFNVPSGRCEACEGYGSTRLEMDFLADIWVTCPVCNGHRFNHETLEVRFKGKNIADVLELDVQQALVHFENVPKIVALLKTLHDVGLDYIKLGQPSPTLSGGEAQRIKLARELGKRSTGRTMYLLDEPTTGLHFADIHKLLEVLHGFVAAGNTVLVVEHNLDVIKTADWVIDLGPEGGAGGGTIVVAGTPEDIAACETSYTGHALSHVLPAARATSFSGDPKGSAGVPRRQSAPLRVAAKRNDAKRESAAHNGELKNITVRGAAQHNLQHVDIDVPRHKMSVFCGPSGSGKSSLAMDTLYAEGQRRYVESLSSYARQFLGQMPKPKVEHISGLSPAIAIEQKTVGNTPRSTVGTVTEIYDYLRILFARLGQSYCPECDIPVATQTTDEVIDQILTLSSPPLSKGGQGGVAPPIAEAEKQFLLLMAPQEVEVGASYEQLWAKMREQGFRRVRVDGVTYKLDGVPEFDRRRKHDVEIVVDRVAVSRETKVSVVSSQLSVARRKREPAHSTAADVPSTTDHGQLTMDKPVSRETRSRLAESVEAALDLGRGWIHVVRVSDDTPEPEWRIERFSLHKACRNCGRSFEDLSPHNFSFNSALGWCPACEGLGVQQGTNLSALIADPKRTLAGGAIAAWPDVETNELFARMLAALSRQFALPLDVPFDRLDPRHQRMVLYGTGDKWITLDEGVAGSDQREGPATRATGPSLRSDPATHRLRLDAVIHPVKFQYKGLYPAAEEAARVSMVYRMRLDHLAGEVACSACHGSRLRADAAAMRFQGKTLQQLCDLPLGECLAFLKQIKLKAAEKRVAGDLLGEVTGRMSFLVDVGLHYLTLGRTMPTLSGGESQRIRLAGQVGRALTGVLYVLDEPTIGLHPRDNGRLIAALRQLRDLGNTVILVEHDREVLQAADHLYDFGPGAGRFGGNIVAHGPPKKLEKSDVSLTGKYLSGEQSIPIPATRRMASVVSGPSSLISGQKADQIARVSPPYPRGGRGGSARAEGRIDKQGTVVRGEAIAVQSASRRTDSNTTLLVSPSPPLPLSPSLPPGGGWLELRGARHHNLRDVDLRIPLGTLTCVTGVSGSGKSSLIEETLAKAVARRLHHSREMPGPFDDLLGLELINKVIQVDQQPLGTTPASNPATYTGVFDEIRELFTRLPESKVHGYRPGRFSFNRAGGRCEACEGNGQKCIEMHFLPDVWVECDTCRGRRFNEETLAVKYRGRSIADVLEMSIGQAHELFENIPKIRSILATLCAVGLDYLTLGQSAATLSGGEAQRVKLAAELARPQTGKTLYILDEPTTGLHFDDIRKLLKVLDSLVELGNTVVVIEHNLDVIKTADWIIDLGPEAGAEGGWIVAEGTPEDVVSCQLSVVSCQLPVVRGRKKRNIRPTTDNQQLTTDHGQLTTDNQQLTTDHQPLTTDLRSHTAELLAPILAAGMRREREIFNVQEAAKKRTGDLDLRQVGRDARMPWQTDGRRWHVADRVSHTGRPARWEGPALETIIDAIEAAGQFAPVNWNDRSVVEVTANGATGGWFLHALTGDEWLLTLKFRVARNAFREEKLQQQLDLKPLDDLDELPVYGRGERVRVKNSRAAGQEVTITVHWLREIDTPAFRVFLQQAIASHLAHTRPAKLNLDDLTPWKVLGKKWHLSRKGFPSGKRVAWEADVLEQLAAVLKAALPNAEIDWSNKQIVYFRRTADDVWAAVHTKRRGGIDLILSTPAGRFALGRIATFGAEREITPDRPGVEQIKIRFTKSAQVTSREFSEFLREHATAAKVV